MKFLLTALLSISLLSPAFAFTVHTSYDANSDYALGDIVPSADANVLFYQASAALTAGTHSLSNTSQWTPVASSDIPNNGNSPSEAVPESAPTEAAPSDIPSSEQNARLVSVSVRGQIGAGDDKRIMGFILSSSGDVLMRGIGPTLAEYGLPSSSLLPDPQISLFKYNDATNISLGSTAVSEGDNDNYTTNSNISSIESARTSLTPVVSLNAVQAASLPTLSTGFYTCQVEDVNGETGIGVAAVDLVNSPSSSFTHLSSRGPVSTGEFMFGSFQITGTGTRKVYIRGRGPSLSQYGVPNVMADTKIVLYKYVNDPNDDQSVDPAVLVGENDDFGTNANASEISSLSTSLYGWPVIETSEAALLIDLDPGYYSAQLQSTSSANDGNGWIGIDDVTDN
tara:strand:+ start:422 stop:1609 length:1188 start_codon:yes stop_codon:yes gene_type:complete